MATTEAATQGVERTQAPHLNLPTDDPFASQRQAENGNNAVKADDSPVDRRTSTDEWDAAKTPPSRFQQRKGSVFATPNSRDGHVGKHVERDAKFHELVDKKYSGKRRPSSSKGEKPEV